MLICEKYSKRKPLIAWVRTRHTRWPRKIPEYQASLAISLLPLAIQHPLGFPLGVYAKLATNESSNAEFQNLESVQLHWTERWLQQSSQGFLPLPFHKLPVASVPWQVVGVNYSPELHFTISNRTFQQLSCTQFKMIMGKIFWFQRIGSRYQISTWTWVCYTHAELNIK